MADIGGVGGLADDAAGAGLAVCSADAGVAGTAVYEIGEVEIG